MSDANDKTKILDACIKCSACSAICPVAAANPLFPGPKSLGPDAERFRLEDAEFGTRLLTYCSGCRTCEITCPSGVKITDMIRRAWESTSKSRCNDNKPLNYEIRDMMFGRAEILGKIATVIPQLTNRILKLRLVRKLLEHTLAIDSHAPLPTYGQRFKYIGKNQQRKKQVVFFPGCFINYSDAKTGRAIVKVLEHNGYEVIVPPFGCCGAPLENNFYFLEAKEKRKKNLSLMIPYLKDGIPVITGCTSCGLALKEYPTAEINAVEQCALKTYDLFEFLWELHERNELKQNFKEVNKSLGYHSPCHLLAQGIGTPSVRVLRLIPGVKVVNIDEGCCGLSGSYGFKKEKYEISMQIGEALFNRVKQGATKKEFQTVATECGSCQAQIYHGTGIQTMHPIWFLVQAYGLTSVEY